MWDSPQRCKLGRRDCLGEMSAQGEHHPDPEEPCRREEWRGRWIWLGKAQAHAHGPYDTGQALWWTIFHIASLPTS